MAGLRPGARHFSARPRGPARQRRRRESVTTRHQHTHARVSLPCDSRSASAQPSTAARSPRACGVLFSQLAIRFVSLIFSHCRCLLSAARRRRVNEDPHAATPTELIPQPHRAEPSLPRLCVRRPTPSANDTRTPLALFFHFCTLYLCAHCAATIALPVVRCLRQQHFRSPLALICPFECHFSITPLNHVQKNGCLLALTECTAHWPMLSSKPPVVSRSAQHRGVDIAPSTSAALRGRPPDLQMPSNGC